LKDHWKQYINLDQDIECFFIESNNNITEPYIQDNTLYTRGTEDYCNIFNKTIESLKFFNIYEYDYIIRTNVSSYYDFKLLKEFLIPYPTKHVYAGVINEYMGVRFASGCGMIMTPDVVQLLINNYHIVERPGYIGSFMNYNNQDEYIMDDIAIGYVLEKAGCQVIELPRIDIATKELLYDFRGKVTSSKNFHFRLRCQNREEEVFIRDELLKIKQDATYTDKVSYA